MTTDATTRIFSNGAASTRYLTIPAAMAMDSQFPFEEDEEVSLRIDGDRLVVEPVEALDRGR